VEPIQYQKWCDVQLAALNAEPLEVQRHAADGVAGTGTSLPHQDAIQSSFGHHDIGGVQAHVGGPAAGAAAAMGAEAYATGNQVAFTSAPDLHLAAHEAAHVVQQRSGVQLKGGIGTVGDAYEQHADAVADAVVRGESAAAILDQAPSGSPAMDMSVQRQAAPGAAQAASAQVDLTVKWHGKLGGDLSARVGIRGRADKKSPWAAVHTEVVADPDGVAGARSQVLSHTFQVARYAEYEVTVVPTPVDPDDRYRNTKTEAKVGASSSNSSVDVSLTIQRENDKNVDDIWQDRRIDPARAEDMLSVPLFGGRVQVNRAAKSRVDATQASFLALPAETQAAIVDSLYVVGGYNKRLTSEGFYSNHSIGSAIDVNYNKGTKQAHHFEQTDMALLTKLVEPVVRTDPSFAGFQISGRHGAKGVDQLRAAQVFSERFPRYLAQLFDRANDVQRFDEIDTADRGLITPPKEVLREMHAFQMFDAITPADFTAAIATAKSSHNSSKATQLELVRNNWNPLQAWLFGALGNPDAKAKGMIPIREDVLRLFLDAGWSWGGDWDSEKDYMHFDDPTVEAAVRQRPAAAPATGGGSGHP